MDVTTKENYLQQIELAIDTVRPFLQGDGGDVEIMDLDESMQLTLKLIGTCKDCSMSAMTMKAGIEDAIRKAVPQVMSVTAV